jgi:hypothetical protein
MLPTKFRFIWLGSFRGEDFLDIDQSETRIACGGQLGQDCQHLTVFIVLYREFFIINYAMGMV